MALDNESVGRLQLSDKVSPSSLRRPRLCVSWGDCIGRRCLCRQYISGQGHRAGLGRHGGYEWGAVGYDY